MAPRKPGDEPDPAAELLGRWQAHHAGEPVQPEPTHAAPVRPTPPGAARGSDRPVGMATDVVFAPRLLARRVLGWLVLVSLVATCAAAYLAYDRPGTPTLGLAGTLVVVTLVLYAVRVSAAPARLSIRGGQLEVVRGGTREVFDLTSRFTRMEVVGRPGRRGWKVLMARFGRDPLVIDASMVDPVAFTAALEAHRPR